MNVPDITAVKDKLESLKGQGLIATWELPYENLLTRLTAAIFFVEPSNAADTGNIWNEFHEYENFSHRANKEKKLSTLKYRLTFSQEQKEANMALAEEANPVTVS